MTTISNLSEINVKIFLDKRLFAIFRPHHCEHNSYYDAGEEAEPQGGTRPGRLRSGGVPQ